MTIVDIHEKPSDLLLPDPEPQRIRYTLISVDDHLVEPPWLFEGRLPARFADQAPRVVRATTAVSTGNSTARSTPSSA